MEKQVRLKLDVLKVLKRPEKRNYLLDITGTPHRGWMH